MGCCLGGKCEGHSVVAIEIGTSTDDPGGGEGYGAGAAAVVLWLRRIGEPG